MKRPNKRHRAFLECVNQLVEQYDDGVLFRKLAYLPHVESASRCSGYYGSVTIKMTNGHEIFELYRHQGKHGFDEYQALRTAIIRVLRYNRRGK